MFIVGFLKGDFVYIFFEIDDVLFVCIGLFGCDVFVLVDKVLVCFFFVYFLFNFFMSFVNDKIVVYLFYRVYKWFRI